MASKRQLPNSIQSASTVEHAAYISSLKAQRSPQRAKAKEEEQRRKANLTEWPGSVMIPGAAGQNARSSSCPLVPYSIYRFFMYHNNAQYACLHTCPPPHAQYSLFSNYFIAGVRTRIIYRFATARQALCLVTPIIAPNPLMLFGLPRLPRSTYTGEPSGEIRGNKRLANHNRWRKDQTGNSKTVMTSKRACFRSIRAIREMERTSSKALASSHRSSTLFEFRTLPSSLVFNICYLYFQPSPTAGRHCHVHQRSFDGNRHYQER